MCAHNHGQRTRCTCYSIVCIHARRLVCREARKAKVEVAADVDTMARQLALVRRQLDDAQEDRQRVIAEYQKLVNAM
jgi:hypothetical protein